MTKALIAVLLIAGSTAAFAQGMPGTPQEQSACRPDTRRFCISIKPDAGPFAYLACLQQHREKLTKACKAVLESHGQ
ncbi:MAG: cysteine rich repeat-containing protein [Xanthobacteraceae bacterium]